MKKVPIYECSNCHRLAAHRYEMTTTRCDAKGNVVGDCKCCGAKKTVTRVWKDV